MLWCCLRYCRPTPTVHRSSQSRSAWKLGRKSMTETHHCVCMYVYMYICMYDSANSKRKMAIALPVDVRTESVSTERIVKVIGPLAIEASTRVQVLFRSRQDIVKTAIDLPCRNTYRKRMQRAHCEGHWSARDSESDWAFAVAPKPLGNRRWLSHADARIVFYCEAFAYTA